MSTLAMIHLLRVSKSFYHFFINEINFFLGRQSLEGRIRDEVGLRVTAEKSMREDPFSIPSHISSSKVVIIFKN